jgi:hypothetical protein
VHIHLLTGTSFNSDGGAGGGSVGTGWFFGEDAGICLIDNFLYS